MNVLSEHWKLLKLVNVPSVLTLTRVKICIPSAWTLKTVGTCECSLCLNAENGWNSWMFPLLEHWRGLKFVFPLLEHWRWLKFVFPVLERWKRLKPVNVLSAWTSNMVETCDCSLCLNAENGWNLWMFSLLEQLKKRWNLWMFKRWKVVKLVNVPPS